MIVIEKVAVGEKSYTLEMIDSRQILMSCDSISIISTMYNKHGNIETIRLIKDISFSLNEIIKIENTFPINFKIKSIERVKKGKFLFTCNQRTKSTEFLLPILGKNFNYFKTKQYLVNVYLKNNLASKLDVNKNLLYLQYRFFDVEDYLNFEYELKKHELYYDKKEIDENFTMFYFYIPEEFNKDLTLFKSGNYSLFSKKLKDRIINFWQLTPDSLMFKVLQKDEKYKKQLELILNCDIPSHLDLYDSPDMEIETFDIDKL